MSLNWWMEERGMDKCYIPAMRWSMHVFLAVCDSVSPCQLLVNFPQLYWFPGNCFSNKEPELSFSKYLGAANWFFFIKLHIFYVPSVLASVLCLFFPLTEAFFKLVLSSWSSPCEAKPWTLGAAILFYLQEPGLEQVPVNLLFLWDVLNGHICYSSS